ncbi:chromate transporter [Treponema primitia]|uniref:chromate transporter n=1 Tax=Treponema primitia TaxID=88058 RepID=UPI0002555254|nr:chromate transporter [Treponema primitia]
MKLLFLFVQFFKIGLFSIGGGYATLPFLYEMADKYDWLSVENIGDMLAVAQSLPGAIGVNLSAYTGFQYAGIPGGLIASIGLISPSVIIIIIVARILNTFKESKVVDSLFSGFRPAGAGLLSAAALGALAISLYNPAAEVWTAMFRWRECILFAAIFLLIKLLKKHPVVYIAAAGVVGIVLGL